MFHNVTKHTASNRGPILIMTKERIYHIMIDRFFPSGKPDAEGNFKGGSIKDIISHLDYIQALGMTGIMLTPFYKTAAYHGYHIVDFAEVDPHFGTWNDIDELVDETHKRGMVIVADFVANHCHIKNKLFSDGEHRDWFLNDNNENYHTYAKLPDLPVFNTSNPEVVEFMSQQALRLCKIGFDAIRLDHATGPTYTFWKTFAKNIKFRFPQVRLIGEVWGKLDFKPHNRLRYLFNRIRYDAQEARQLEYVDIFDGLLDFKYQSLVVDAIHKNKLNKKEELYEKVKRHLKRYPKDFQLWLFLDNHDLNRILFECGGDTSVEKRAIDFTLQWDEPFLMFYGTEKELTNHKSIFDGTPYADERVRMPLI